MSVLKTAVAQQPGTDLVKEHRDLVYEYADITVKVLEFRKALGQSEVRGLKKEQMTLMVNYVRVLGERLKAFEQKHIVGWEEHSGFKPGDLVWGGGKGGLVPEKGEHVRMKAWSERPDVKPVETEEEFPTEVSAEELWRLQELDKRHKQGDFRQGNY